MSAGESADRVKLPAWQGWIRKGSDYPSSISKKPDGEGGLIIEMGAAIIKMPDPARLATNSWACSQQRLCAFAGALYNGDELVEELFAGESSSTSTQLSPADIVLLGYRRWGDDVLDHCDGAFALAIWDQSERRLLIGRDAVGLHPFYYAQMGSDLVFSWDMETVLCHPLVSRDLDRAAVAEFLTHHWPLVEETLYKHVRRLPGGSGMTFQSGQVSVNRYWIPISEDIPSQWATEDELRDFPNVFKRSVERTMKSAGGQTGIFLSGGLDSVGIAVSAHDSAEANNWPKPHALSVIFPEPYSEIEIQQAVAEKLGLAQSFTNFDDYRQGRSLLRRAAELSRTAPWPATFTGGPIFADLADIAKAHGCSAIFSGDGGDELLGVAPLYAADLIRDGDLAGLYRLIRVLQRFWKGSPLIAIQSVLWRNGVRSIGRDWVWRNYPNLAARRRRQLLTKAYPSWVVPDPELRREVLERFEERWVKEVSKTNFYKAAVARTIGHPLALRILEEHFYRYAPSGVTLLRPFWDRPVADLLLRVHPEVLNGGGRWKALMRDVLSDRLPEMGFAKQKKNLSDGKDLMRREGPEIWNHLRGPRCLSDLGVIDELGFGEMVSRSLESDDIMKLHRIWHAATTETWLRARLC